MPVVASPEQLTVSETAISERANADGSKAVVVVNKIGLAAAAHLVSLDEIWKAQPPVLKVLFDLLLADGVRLGGKFHETPTLGVLAASNELPEEGNQLEALWARMAFRFDVRPLDRSGKFSMLQKRREQDLNGKEKPVQHLELVDLHTLQEARHLVVIGDDIFKDVLDIYEALVQKDQAGFQWLWDDDRRLDMVREGLQAYALMHGRTAVTRAHLAVLEYMLWNTQEQISVIRGVLAPYIRTPLSEVQELVDALLSPSGTVETVCKGDRSKGVPAITQCEEALKKIAELSGKASDDGMRKAIDTLKQQVESKKQDVVAVVTGQKTRTA